MTSALKKTISYNTQLTREADIICPFPAKKKEETT